MTVEAEEEIQIPEISGVSLVGIECFKRIAVPIVAIKGPNVFGEKGTNALLDRWCEFGLGLGMLKDDLAKCYPSHHMGAEEPFAIKGGVARVEVGGVELSTDLGDDGSGQLPLSREIAGDPRVGPSAAPGGGESAKADHKSNQRKEEGAALAKELHAVDSLVSTQRFAMAYFVRVLDSRCPRFRLGLHLEIL